MDLLGPASALELLTLPHGACLRLWESEGLGLQAAVLGLSMWRMRHTRLVADPPCRWRTTRSTPRVCDIPFFSNAEQRPFLMCRSDIDAMRMFDFDHRVVKSNMRAASTMTIRSAGALCPVSAPRLLSALPWSTAFEIG